MSCYHPITAFRTPDGVVFSELRRYDILGRIELPCGQCIGCRLRRASDWALRVEHEASLWPANCFVTLTYGRDAVPPGGSLVHRDFQLFMKRLRKVVKRPLRYFMCGEYGPSTMRPHYHACLFNIDFRFDRVWSGRSQSGEDYFSSLLLTECWSHGRCSVQDLNKGTAGYCARYTLDKLTGDVGAAFYGDRVVPYGAMSLRPCGIGAGWLMVYKDDVYPRDYVVAGGVKRRPPKYYDKVIRGESPLLFEGIDFARETRGRLCAADSSDERLAVRESVQLASMSFNERDVYDVDSV